MLKLTAIWGTAHTFLSHSACKAPGWQFISGPRFKPELEISEASVSTSRVETILPRQIQAFNPPTTIMLTCPMIPHVLTIHVLGKRCLLMHSAHNVFLLVPEPGKLWWKKKHAILIIFTPISPSGMFFWAVIVRWVWRYFVGSQSSCVVCCLTVENTQRTDAVWWTLTQKHFYSDVSYLWHFLNSSFTKSLSLLFSAGIQSTKWEKNVLRRSH